MRTACEGLTEVAASIIVMKFVIEIVLERREARDKRIERDAVKAEYQATANAESYSVFHKIETDESEPEWKRMSDPTTRESDRKNNLLRQSQMLMRYPQHLIPGPKDEYIRKASQWEIQNNLPFKDNLKQHLKSWLGSLAIAGVVGVIFYGFSLAVKAAWTFFIG